MKLVFADLYAAVANDMSTRYCPVDRTLFLGRLATLIAVFAGIALLAFAIARFRTRNPQRREFAYIGAWAIAAFAIGSGVLVIYGLSGCAGPTQAGLTWDWPW